MFPSHDPANGYIKFDGVRFEDMVTLYDRSVDQDCWVQFTNCVFKNVSKVAIKTGTQQFTLDVTLSVFDSCGDGSNPLFPTIASLGAGFPIRFSSNTVYNLDIGATTLWYNLGGTGVDQYTGFQNNIFSDCTMGLVYRDDLAPDGNALWARFVNNTYYNNSLTNFCRTATTTHATLAAFQAARS